MHCTACGLQGNVFGYPVKSHIYYNIESPKIENGMAVLFSQLSFPHKHIILNFGLISLETDDRWIDG